MSSEEVWVLYRKSKNPELRQRLLAEYLPLVKSVAGRMAMGFPRSVELSDLVSTGVIGLIEAFGNFDPSRGVKFETYAVPRIRGAILDELRALDWVPRSTRAKSRVIEKALVKLENKLGRIPAKVELARSLKITTSELYDALGDACGSTVLSLDELVYKEDDNRQVPRVETVGSVQEEGVLGQIEHCELKEFMVSAIGHLTEQERLVVTLYYYEELTLKEIGEVMQISESRVSQIHTKAIMKLRSMIRERFPI
ncbi:MAG TPA: FliA/WhiG family RNA polymerase sigma factor [candidate division Zixibacteria bacterium]